MKKIIFASLFAIGALTTISVNASNQEPENNAPCPVEQCNPAPCDTVCAPATCAPAAPCAPEGC